MAAHEQAGPSYRSVLSNEETAEKCLSDPRAPSNLNTLAQSLIDLFPTGLINRFIAID